MFHVSLWMFSTEMGNRQEEIWKVKKKKTLNGFYVFVCNLVLLNYVYTSIVLFILPLNFKYGFARVC